MKWDVITFPYSFALIVLFSFYVVLGFLKITTTTYKEIKNRANERKVIPDPIDDRKFQEWKESGKSGILLGITLNPRKCIGEKVSRIPINVQTKW